MRIITGSARGRKLKSLPGLETRPTSDRLKETMFNIVQFAVEGRRVLDLFAGSGQLGLEALSRGAASCTFVDMNGGAAAVIRDNAEHTGFTGQSKVVTGEAIRFLAEERERYDLIFLDPPYHTPLLGKAVLGICRGDLLREGGFVLCECADDDKLPDLEAPYKVKKVYDYGHKRLVLIERKEEME